jgi:protein-tyrosine phosphatase
MAEAVFRHKVEEANLSDKIECDSAGVSYASFGDSVHPHTMATLASNGIYYDHTPRRIYGSDLQDFDYALAMDTSVLQSIWGMGKGRAKVEPFMKYTRIRGFEEVPDPIRTNNFELVYNLVSDASDGFLAVLRQKYNL